MDSYLKIEGMAFPSYSCREAQQTLRPIAWGEFRRTVNGELRYTGLPAIKKYKTIIQCQDQVLPPFHRLWAGATMTIHCLSVLTDVWSTTDDSAKTTEDIQLHREPVPGSILINGVSAVNLGQKIKWSEALNLAKDQSAITIQYRPILTMKITHFSYEDYEWENKVAWQLAAEEI